MTNATEAASAAGTEAAAEAAAKERIHSLIDQKVSEKVGKRIGLATAKDIFDSVVEEIFKAAVKDGQIRFPGGYGSFHVKKLGVGTKPKRLPSGQEVTLGEGRVKLRYQEGVSVKRLLGTDKKPQPNA